MNSNSEPVKGIKSLVNKIKTTLTQDGLSSQEINDTLTKIHTFIQQPQFVYSRLPTNSQLSLEEDFVESIKDNLVGLYEKKNKFGETLVLNIIAAAKISEHNEDPANVEGGSKKRKTRKAKSKKSKKSKRSKKH